MIKAFEDWIKENNLEEKEEDILDKIYSNEHEIKEVVVGCTNREHVASEYFEKEYPCMASVHSIDNTFFLEYTETDYGYIKAYTSEKEAMEELDKLEDSLYSKIDDEIFYFKECLPEEISIDTEVYVNREYNNSGNFYSFNITYKDFLLVDGCFDLNADYFETDVKEFNSFCNDLEKEHEITIKSIYKDKYEYSFTRYYNVKVCNRDSEIDYEVPISGTLQGQPRTVLKFLKEVDIDEILELLEEE